MSRRGRPALEQIDCFQVTLQLRKGDGETRKMVSGRQKVGDQSGKRPQESNMVLAAS